MKAKELVSSFRFGSKLIKYDIEFRNRKTLGIIVTPQQLVKVYAPMNSSFDKIEKIIRKKALWIIRSIEYFESVLPKLPPKSYVSGESYYYLGKHYRLKVYKSNLEDARLNRNHIQVFTKHKNNSRVVRIILNYWYKERARKKFSERFEKGFGLFKNYSLNTPLLSIRIMKTRWGSCNTKNKIVLNQELVKMPIRCIDYVIMHELCHLLYRNHDHQFYNLLTSVMPDWKERKMLLERNAYKI